MSFTTSATAAPESYMFERFEQVVAVAESDAEGGTFKRP
jgi:hypothetical protein